MLTKATRFLADADYPEARRLAAQIFRDAMGELKSADKDAATVLSSTRKRWDGLLNLLSGEHGFLGPREVAQVRASKKLIDGFLSPRAALQRDIASWEKQLADASGTPSRTRRVTSKTRATVADRLVPVKTFVGLPGWEDLSDKQRAEFARKTGTTPSWGATGWLQLAVDLANGKRTVRDIHDALRESGFPAKLDALVNAMRLLARCGKVRFRPLLTAADIARACRCVGIMNGDLVMAHVSLSEFGYVRGGADAMIDALLRVVGRTGTLAMTTHSLSWVGNLPYDPNTSPGLTGVVPNVFLKRAGVIRSLHPTHSVAARGPLAETLLRGHDHTVAPQAMEGFWGKFVAANGKVLLLSTLNANTLLHAGELWGGVPYPPVCAHLMKNGRRMEVTVPALPWHVNFKRTHDSLRRRSLLQSARFGEGTIHSMRAQDAVATTLKMVERDPLVATEPSCNCRYCRHVRAHLGGAKRRSH
jgi:aminoglycoside 3-N-acetyltransferase